MDKEVNYSGFYKDFLENKVAFNIHNNYIFNNTKCLFCEFNDIIVPTWLCIINHILKTKPVSLLRILDVSEIIDYSEEDLIKWYAFRKHRNALLDLKREDISDDAVNAITNELFNEHFAYYNTFDSPVLMNYGYTLKRTIRAASNIIDKFVVYVEQCNSEVDKFLTSIYGSKLSIRSGDLVGALSDISSDSTFVFSDVRKINALKEADKLRKSSIIIADGYGYNYKSYNGSIDDFVIDVNSLINEYDFTVSFFDNFTE